MIDISIVIPVFNSSRYLPDCFDSIRSQKFSNLQIIFVDDASTDSSPQLLESFRAMDSRVETYHLDKNSGAGAARNFGIAKSKGTYIQFIDSDDLLGSRSLAVMYKSAESNNADFVRGNCLVFRELDSQTTTPMRFIEWVTDSKNVNYRRKNFQGLPWCHPAFLFRRSFLSRNKIKYPKLSVGEDPIFLLKSLLSAERGNTVSNAVYYYRSYKKHSDRFTDSMHLKDYLAHYMRIKAIWIKANMRNEWERYFSQTFWWLWEKHIQTNVSFILENLGIIKELLEDQAAQQIPSHGELDLELIRNIQIQPNLNLNQYLLRHSTID